MNPKYKKLIEEKGLDNVIIDLIERIEKLEENVEVLKYEIY